MGRDARDADDNCFACSRVLYIVVVIVILFGST